MLVKESQQETGILLCRFISIRKPMYSDKSVFFDRKLSDILLSSLERLKQGVDHATRFTCFIVKRMDFAWIDD